MWPNYAKENFCSDCNLKFPKTVVNCKVCKKKLRTKPRAGKRHQHLMSTVVRY